MKINILCIGSIKEKYFNDAIDEYVKRLRRFHKINIIELKEEKLQKNSTSEIQKVIEKESLVLESKMCGFVIVLDSSGKKFTSINFAEFIDKLTLSNSELTFVIGGSYGITNELKNKADLLLSFSDFTFPHQLMRVILLEQLYRITTINNNIAYAK